MILAQLLGKRIDDPQVEQFVRGLGPVEADDDVDDEDDDESYHSYPSGGVSLLVGNDTVVRAIFLYPQGRDGFDAYAGEIDGGVTFADVRADVIRRLGEPSASGGGERSALYAEVPQWIRYDRPDHTLHVELGGPGGVVSLVTLMTLSATPS
jgi:hypothetical protein